MKTYFEHLVQVYKSSGYSLKEGRESKRLLLSKQKAGDPPLASTSYMVQEDWDELMSESPTYGSDLRDKFKKATGDRSQQYNKSIQTLIDKHPDMYIRDTEGKVIKYKTDAKGYVMLDGKPVQDPNGRPMVNMETEKAKIFVEIAGEDHAILSSVKAPLIIMEATENRLRIKKDKDVAKQIEEEGKEKETKREKKVDAAALATGGTHQPLPKEDEVVIKYENDQEKAHVLKQIKNGFYKTEKEYFQAKKRGIEIGTQTHIGNGRGGY